MFSAGVHLTAAKEKILTEGTDKGKVINKPKTKIGGKGKGKNKALVAETSAYSSIRRRHLSIVVAGVDADAEGGGQGLRVGNLGITSTDTTEKAADAQPSTRSGSSIGK